MTPRERSRFARYGVALTAVLVASLVRSWLTPILGDSLPFLTLFGAVAFAVWYSGSVPALVAAMVGFLVADYAYLPPRGSLELGADGLVAFGGYMFSAGLIIAFGESMHRARDRASADAQARLAAEQEAIRQRQWLATTLASIGDAVIATAADGRVTFLNAEAERLTGWKSAEAAGRPLDEVFPIVNEQTRQPVESPVQKVIRTGMVVGLANHTVLLRRDGTEIPIDDSAAPIREDGGPLLGVVLVFRDYTEQRRHDEERGRLSAIVASSGDAIISKDLNGLVRTWNASAERLFGYRADEIVGRPISLIIPAERLQEEKEILERLRRGLASERLDTVRLTKDGREVEVSVSVSPVKNRDGEVIGASKIAHDISARKAARREREALLAREHEARQSAEEANRLKDEFLATLSHELRNPLNVILGYSEVLTQLEEVKASPNLLRISESLRRNARAQSQLISDLLDLSRLHTGKLSVNRETVSLVTAVHHAVETVRSDAEAQRVAIEIEATTDALLVNADPLRLQQVFWNLLNNAVKFTPAGGRVAIRLAADGAEAVVAVGDTGRGIDPAFLPHVFDIFRQADAGSGKQRPGMGIGLALVQQLLELQGGSVSAASEGLGKGAVFTVRLPLLPRDAPMVQPPAPALDGVLDGLRVLVVDDSPDTLDLLRDVLQLHGAAVETAHGGVEALQIAAHREFDLVVSDISMPRMDGFEFIRGFKQLPGRDRVPAIALTGFGRAQDIERASGAGFVSHLTKPLTPAVLIETVRKLRAGQ